MPNEIFNFLIDNSTALLYIAVPMYFNYVVGFFRYDLPLYVSALGFGISDTIFCINPY